MKLIVGLGNPGGSYRDNRHNVGFMVVESLSSKKWATSKNKLLQYLWLNSDIELIKPQTFMNSSGDAVAYELKKHKVTPKNLYVIHDDLDIALGEYKIQFGKEPKDHNGLKSINDRIGTSSYWHVRVGVDNRNSNNRTPGEDYVLADFSDDERQILDKTIIELCKKLETLFKNTN